jgi:CubicO group peptidase (beta-lactamase class C family)
MAQMSGHCDKKFEEMRQVLSKSIDLGADLGASVAITIDGKFVVDMWGGWVDEAKTIPWAENTLTNVWSTTKTMAALCALALVERGQLDVDAPVSKYWPEFAANGKEGVLVRHIMSHTSGVSGWAQPVVIEDIFDWDKSTRMLAAQAPWWEPGTASGYHALSQGHLIGEVVRRITDVSLGTFFKREIAGPLGADFHIGLAPSEFGRVSNVIPPPPLPFDMAAMDPNSVAMKTLTGPILSNASDAWRPGVATSRNPCGERPRQRPLRRPHSVDCRQRRRGGRRPVAVQVDHRHDLPPAVRRSGPRARAPVAIWHRLRASVQGDGPLHPRRKGVLLGRLWRIDDHRRCRAPDDDRLHDEQDGIRHHRRRAQRGTAAGRVRGLGSQPLTCAR